MRTGLIAMLAFTVGLVGFARAAVEIRRHGEDEEAVRQTLGHYIEGHETGSAGHMEMAFHPDAKLFWVRDGELNQRTLQDWLSGFTGEPAEDEAPPGAPHSPPPFVGYL